MSAFGTVKAKKLYNTLLKIGWSVKRQGKGSHTVLEREGYPDFVFSFHAGTEVGPRMLSRVAKQTGLKSSDF